MTLDVTGKLDLKINEETTLKATSNGGISPYTYTWTFPDSTTKTGPEQKIKYSTAGSRDIKVSAKDKEGNIKENTIKLDVNEYYDLTIEVRTEDNQVLQGAIVTVNSETKATDNTGKVTFNLPKKEYVITVSAQNYITKTETVDLDKATSLTIKLNNRQTQTTTTQTNTASDNIKLLNPTNNARLTNADVNFEAELSLQKTSTCKLFITDKNSQWFVEFARKENVNSEKITFSEKLDIGEYKWKISCENSNKTEESKIRELSIATTQLSTTAVEDTIDAGELRRKIETAHENLDKLDMTSRRVADAINLQETLRISLRDYERILRDINSLAMRRDLVEVQKEDKLAEYKEAAKTLEETTPLDIEVHESQEFIAFPDEETLENIANIYGAERNLQGKLDIKDVEQMQNLIRVRTFTALVTITYLNGEREDITLVHKTTEYTGETTRNHFLLESIPTSSNTNLDIKQVHDVLIKNELIRFEKPEVITYTINGHKELEDIKNHHTILLSEAAFKAGSSGTGLSSITGRITLTGSDLTSTKGLVIIIIILLLAYLAFLFDLKDKVVVLVSSFGKDKKLKELSDLIDDAKDYLSTNNLNRANLIYKEIRMLYEKSPVNVKNQIYDDVINLINVLNEAYLSYLVDKTFDELKNNNKKESIKLYNKLTDVYNKSNVEIQKLFREKIMKIHQELKN
jgi:hypothetical protein